MALYVAQNIQAQGFVNLNFESADLSGYSPDLVPAADAIPGWTAYLGATPLTNIYYDVPASDGLGVYIYNSTKVTTMSTLRERQVNRLRLGKPEPFRQLRSR